MRGPRRRHQSVRLAVEALTAFGEMTLDSDPWYEPNLATLRALAPAA
jgi:hypothetical protein